MASETEVYNSLNYSQLLGATPLATNAEIRKAFQKKQLMYLSDKGGCDELSKTINVVCPVLSDKPLKVKYDQEREDNEEDEGIASCAPQLNSGFKLSDEFKVSIEKCRNEFNTVEINDNLFECFSELSGEILQDTPKKEEHFFCSLCTKKFLSTEEHYDQVLHPYIQLFDKYNKDGTTNNDIRTSDIFELLKEAFGYAYLWRPTTLSNDVGMWACEEWENYDINQIAKDVSQIIKLLPLQLSSSQIKNGILRDLTVRLPIVANIITENQNIDLSSIKLKRNHKKEILKPGQIVPIDANNLRLGFSLDENYVPFYQITESPLKSPSRNCSICGRNANSFLGLLNAALCSRCGKTHCKTCQVKKPILHLGFDSKVKVCTTCSVEVDVYDANIWFQESMRLLHSGKFEICQRYLEMCSLYFQNSGYEKVLLSKWDEIRGVALEKKQYDIYLQVIKYCQPSNDTWEDAAFNLASIGADDYAATSLEFISSNESKFWVDLGGKFASVEKPSLVLYCYKYKAKLSIKKWIQIAEFYDSLDRNFRILSFNCIREASKLDLWNYKEWCWYIQMFLIKEKWRLALTCCAARKFEFEIYVEIAMDLVKKQHYKSVVMLVNYIYYIHKDQVEAKIENIPDPFVQAIFWILNKAHLYTVMEQLNILLHEQNIKDCLVFATFMKMFNPWKLSFDSKPTWSEICVEQNELDMAILFAKMETESRQEDLWPTLGLQIRQQNKDPAKAHICFILGGCDLNHVAEDFRRNGNHKAAIEYYLKTKSMRVIRRNASILLNSDPNSSFYYYSTVVKFLRSHNDLTNKIESTIDIIQEIFTKKGDRSIYFTSIFQTFPEIFFDKSVYKIHRHFIHEFSRDKTFKSAALILGTLHFLPRGESKYNPTYLDKVLLTIRKNLLTESIYFCDFKVLNEALTYLDQFGRDVIFQVFEDQFGQRNLNSFPQCSRAMMYLIRGTIKKNSGEILAALSDFEEALNTSPYHCFEDISEIISKLLEDNFHEQIVHQIYRELTILRGKWQNKEYIDTSHYHCMVSNDFPTNICNYKNFLSSSNVDIVVIKKCDLSISKGNYDPLDAAYSYMDLCMSASSSTIGTFLMSASYILKAINQSNEPASIFAYRNAIFELAGNVYPFWGRLATPYLKFYSFRILLSVLIMANQKLSESLKNFTPTSSNNKTQLISSKHRLLLKALMTNIVHLSKINPLINTPAQSCLDTIFVNITRTEFLRNFLAQKILQKHHSTLFPHYLYTYYQFEGVWRGWIDNIDFNKAKLLAMISLLESRGWQLEDVQHLMEWPLIRREPDGWLNSKNYALNFKEESTFSSIGGVQINFGTGEISFLLSSDGDKSRHTFSSSDISEIFKNEIDCAWFTLEEPDCKMMCHPFQEAKYFPKRISGTNYLQSLIRADMLLKEITAGVEINSKPPFTMRKTNEVLLKRLPKQLQEVLKPIINSKKAESGLDERAHRFWIEMDDVVYEVEATGSNVILKIGDPKVQVRKCLMKRDENGELIDDCEDTDDSAEAEFAQEFSKNFDEIGKYFPELIRLKELAKISIIYGLMNSVYLSLKKENAKMDNASVINSVESCLQNIRSRITYPFNTYSEVENVITRMVNKRGVSRTQINESIRVFISNELAKVDASTVNEVATILTENYCIVENDIEQFIPDWLTGSKSAKNSLTNVLVQGATQSKKNKNLNTCATFESLGIKGCYANEDKNEEITANDECIWLPAAFSNNVATDEVDSQPRPRHNIYGGINMIVNVSRGTVQSTTSYSIYSGKELLARKSNEERAGTCSRLGQNISSTSGQHDHNQYMENRDISTDQGAAKLGGGIKGSHHSTTEGGQLSDSIGRYQTLNPNLQSTNVLVQPVWRTMEEFSNFGLYAGIHSSLHEVIRQKKDRLPHLFEKED